MQAFAGILIPAVAGRALKRSFKIRFGVSPKTNLAPERSGVLDSPQKLMRGEGGVPGLPLGRGGKK